MLASITEGASSCDYRLLSWGSKVVSTVVRMPCHTRIRGYGSQLGVLSRYMASVQLQNYSTTCHTILDSHNHSYLVAQTLVDLLVDPGGYVFACSCTRKLLDRLH